MCACDLGVSANSKGKTRLRVLSHSQKNDAMRPASLAPACVGPSSAAAALCRRPALVGRPRPGVCRAAVRVGNWGGGGGGPEGE